MQQELIQMVAQKTGISEDKARTAAETVVGYLKEKMPSTMSSQLDSITSGNIAGIGDAAKGVAGKFTSRE